METEPRDGNDNSRGRTHMCSRPRSRFRFATSAMCLSAVRLERFVSSNRAPQWPSPRGSGFALCRGSAVPCGWASARGAARRRCRAVLSSIFETRRNSGGQVLIGSAEPKTLWHESRVEGMVPFSTNPGRTCAPGRCRLWVPDGRVSVQLYPRHYDRHA